MPRQRVKSPPGTETLLKRIEMMGVYPEHYDNASGGVSRIGRLGYEDILKVLYDDTAYPFYNTQNSQVYSLIHCTSNPAGFELYKKTAWQTFDDHSSNKNTHGNENQLMLDFGDSVEITTPTDESCFNVRDIAKYIQYCFNGKSDVLLEDIYAPLESHPIFPSNGYRPTIKTILKSDYGAVIKTVLNPVTGKRETRVTFSKGTINYE